MLHRKSTHVQFVDDQLMPACVQQPVVPPCESGVDDDAFRHAGRIVATIEGKIGAGRADAIAELRVAPLQRS